MNRALQGIRRAYAVAATLRSGPYGDFAAALLGALLVLAFAPYGCYPLAVLAPMGLLWLIAPVTPRRAALRGFLFGFAEFLCGVHWIYISLHGVGGVDAFVAVLMLVFLVAIMACYSAAACGITAAWAPVADWPRHLLLFPAAWTFMEWVRGWFLTGFSWLSLGYSQVDGPLKGYAPLWGVYGVSFCVILSAGLLFGALDMRYVVQKRIAAAGALSALWAAVTLVPSVSTSHPFHVSLVQGNIAQDEKWQPEYFEPTLDMYRRLTEKHWDSRLVIWPEAAVPAYEDEVKLDYLDPLEADAVKHGTDMLLGIPTYDPAGDHYYNSVISLGKSDGEYHKRHLVPFGENFEFLPAWVRSVLRSMDLPYSSFTPGAADQPLLEAAGYPVGVSICYEDAYGNEIMRALPQAAFLVNVSNDGWFGDSIALPQHLEIARMGALEGGRYLLRATNTGITAIVDAGGHVLSTAPVGEESVLSGDIEPRAGATPASFWGEVPAAGLSFLMLAGFAWQKRRKGGA